MKSMTISKRISCVVFAGVLAVATLTGCGKNNKEAALATINGFLSEAQAGNLTGAADYATEDLMKQIGWSEDDIKEFEDEFYDTLGGAAAVGDVTEIPGGKDSIDKLVDKVKNTALSSYEVDAESYTEKDGVGTTTVKVTRMPDNVSVSVMNSAQSEAISLAQDISAQYIADHPEITEMTDDVMKDLYSERVPALVDLIIEKYDEIEPKSETWYIQTEEVDGKTVIKDILV